MKIFILGFENAFASSLIGLMDIFLQAKVLAGQCAGNTAGESPVVRLVSLDGRALRCQNGIILNTHCAVKDISQADLFIISSIPHVEAPLPGQDFMVDWLRQKHLGGTVLASVCTGAFLLALTGLLDGKEATTHWSAAGEFRAMFPAVRLAPENLIVTHENLCCAAGAGAATDLAYYFLESYFGHSVAVQTAKFFVHDFRRQTQAAYATLDTNACHADPQILKAQTWIETHLDEPFNISDLADIAGLGRRTFERRFKAALGDSPKTHIQKQKVETAKKLLETTSRSFSEISYALGYQNPGSFRKIFTEWTGILPSFYRKTFGAYKTAPLRQQ
ncbi:MAG TPA: hypothetical protein DHV36_21420 [Desulfobacteraceae bacterium]|nr:hypothetical protein [Desulfobacteraceae bacterium]